VDNLGISAQVPHRALRAETPKLPYNKYQFSGFYSVSWEAPGAPGVSSTEKRQSSAIFFSPGILTDAWEMVILQGEAPKLPEILEISSGSQNGGSWVSPAAGEERIRKEKHGLVIRITYTCEVGIGPSCSVFPYCPHFITPQTPKLPQ